MDSLDPKRPAAVVYMERPDGRVLALTREHDYADWHLAGGKYERKDGTDILAQPDLVATAIRELSEETGVKVEREALREIARYTTKSGRSVVAFWAALPLWYPETFFPRYKAGQPAWVPAEMLLMPSCSFADECRHVLAAVASLKLGARC